jgi:hypothetical protein
MPNVINLRGRKSRLVPEGAGYIGGPSIAAGGASLAAAQDRQ